MYLCHNENSKICPSSVQPSLSYLSQSTCNGTWRYENQALPPPLQRTPCCQKLPSVVKKKCLLRNETALNLYFFLSFYFLSASHPPPVSIIQLESKNVMIWAEGISCLHLNAGGSCSCSSCVFHNHELQRRQKLNKINLNLLSVVLW